MDGPTLSGINGVKFPVADLPRSRAWYEQVFGWKAEYEFPDQDGIVRGASGHLAGVPDTFLALRENPAAARGVAGADLINLLVANRAGLEAWAHRLDDLGIDHSPIIDATIGWLLVLQDPDGIELHLYTRERHGIDQTDRPGYGRPVATI
jgi:catechol 2,3-dioxygenase-like lactoylglutathione lyase family enzyme